ncbi:MAG: hypothetical protein WC755_07360 [Candidatus Woesearchaeota archaeon]|jgi:phosphoglycerate-specific signal transduction histidine kinase
MTLAIIIFIISAIGALGMLLFRSWEIKTSRIIIEEEKANFTPELSFRNIEKIILYITKHIIQWVVLFSVKVWYKIETKVKFLIKNKLPKINNFFIKKNNNIDSRKISFVQRAVIESKIKIKKVKEKIKKEHEEALEEIKEEVDKII